MNYSQLQAKLLTLIKNYMNDNIKLTGTYHFKHIRDGAVIDDWTVNNLVTSAGKAQLALLAGDASAVPFPYLALGTSNTAPSVGQTTLVAEITDTGLERALATVSRVTTTVTNDTLQLVYTWTATGSKTIEEVGVFNAASSGTMLSRAITGTKTLVNGETLTATYTLAFS
jgi:hypothetical protein